MENRKYRIAVVDDEALFRRGISMLINDNPKLEATIQAADGRDLLDQLNMYKNNLPDLILCDMEMPIMDGVDTVKALSLQYPDIKIVILSSHYESSLIVKMIEIGASAFMPKNEKPEELYLTMINVIEKGFHYNDFIVQLIKERMQYGRPKKISTSNPLTEREQEVLALICEEMINREIAEKLFISPRTVEGHRKQLLEKTNSKNTAGLIIHAIEYGYYDVEIKNKKWFNI